MTERFERHVGGAEAGKPRFDGETVRRILQRAAEEEHRLNKELADSYSFEDLQEMAAEAGISPAALRTAIDEQRARPAAAIGSAAPSRGWLAALTDAMPRRWPPRVKRAVLAGTGGVAAVGLLLAFPAVAEALFWGTVIALVVFALLVAVGVLPF